MIDAVVGNPSKIAMAWDQPREIKFNMKAKTDSKLALGDLELFAIEGDIIRAHRCDLLARLETIHSKLYF
jgi:hypothetical protein